MKRLITDNFPRLGTAVKDLSDGEGSPCINCLVTASCKRSFVDSSACDKFASFLQNIMIKAGMNLNENKK